MGCDSFAYAHVGVARFQQGNKVRQSLTLERTYEVCFLDEPFGQHSRERPCLGGPGEESHDRGP